MVAVETMQPEFNVISTFTFCPSVILFTVKVLLTEFCLVIPSTLNLYEAETIAVAVNVKSSPLQKVLFMLPVTVNVTTGGLVTTTSYRTSIISTSGRIRVTSYKRFVVYGSINGIGYTRSENKSKCNRVE